MAWEEPLAVALALGYVLLTIRERRLAWILAGVSAALYLRIFFNVGLVMEAGLQLFYIVMAAYGFWAWGKDDSDRQLPVQRWPIRVHAGILVGVLLLGTATGLLLARFTDAALPIPDSITTIAALVTTWMVTRKVLENWLWWIGIDLISIGLYLHRGLDMTALLFAGYVLLAVAGWFRWRNQLQAEA